MPLAIFKKLRLGNPPSTIMQLLTIDRMVKTPVRILCGVLVRVEKFIFLAEFVIIIYKVNFDILIISKRPFLATGEALMDMELR